MLAASTCYHEGTVGSVPLQVQTMEKNVHCSFTILARVCGMVIVFSHAFLERCDLACLCILPTVSSSQIFVTCGFGYCKVLHIIISLLAITVRPSSPTIHRRRLTPSPMATSRRCKPNPDAFSEPEPSPSPSPPPRWRCKPNPKPSTSWLPLPSTLTSPPPSCRRPSFLSCPRPAIRRAAPHTSPRILLHSRGSILDEKIVSAVVSLGMV